MPAAAQSASAALKSIDGKDVGTAQLTQTPSGVLINLSVKGLPAGEHAFHVHAVGKCEPPFTTAGGHFKPAGKKHGTLAAEGHHAGDMPNLHILASGELTVEVVNADVTLDNGRPNSVFDADGSTIVIHAGKTTTRPIQPTTPAAASPVAWSSSSCVTERCQGCGGSECGYGPLIVPSRHALSLCSAPSPGRCASLSSASAAHARAPKNVFSGSRACRATSCRGRAQSRSSRGLSR